MELATQAGRMMQITTPLGEDFLLINKLSADEAISRLFTYEIELLHDEGEDYGHESTIVDEQKFLGQGVEITLTQGDDTTRTFHGIVNRFSQGYREGRFSYYYATIVPSLWILTQIRQSRIFQQMTVPEILQEVLAKFDVQYEQQKEYKKRNYCVQYRETDFDFISRLMEEEGIYYYFKHEDGTHKMIIGDTSQMNLDNPSKNEIDYNVTVSDIEDFVSSIASWRTDYKLQTGKVTFWDFNFQVPKKNLESTEPAAVNIAQNDQLEHYDYPGGYSRKYDGIDKGGGEQAADLQNLDADRQATAKTRIQELDAQYITMSGISDCCAMTAGHRFKMLSHPEVKYNAQYVLTSVKHEVEQSPDYETGEEISKSYGNVFKCIQHTTPFRPERITEKPIVRGGQTALVVGPAGEEIYTDPYGRVKVQFFWDRQGELNESSSCWVRVSQAWAGKNWGMIFIPRIGMEVLIDFLEGDPDQPIITGCVYNAETMPPYELPAEKTKMSIKSSSTPDKKGFNELRFEDKKDSEQVFIHGEKDIDIRNKNDRREYVGNDHHFIVHRDRREKIEGDEHRIVVGEQREEIQKDRSLKIKGGNKVKIDKDSSIDIGGSSRIKVGSALHEEAGQSIYIKAGMKIIIEAPQISLKGAGGFVDVGPGGVTIQGTMVKINSGGAAGSGSSVSVVPPDAPKVADPADDAKPGTKAKLERASNARKEKRHTEDDKKKSWIAGVLKNEAGKGVPGVRYRVTTPDGRIASGSTDKEGKFKVKGFDPGDCKITFPDLDKDAWEEG